MHVDAAAERVYETIKKYMVESGDAELSDEEQKVILVGLLEVLIKEIVTIAVVDALVQTKRAVDEAVKNHLKTVAIDGNKLYERMKKDGHL